MEDTKNKKFLEYINYLVSDCHNFSAAGKRIYAVKMFLDSDYAMTRAGYRKFCAANSLEIANRYYIKESICAFLDWLGLGFSRKKKIKVQETKTLEKLTVLSEKNRESLNGFFNWLSKETTLSHNTISSYVTGVKLFFEYAPEFNTDMCKAYIATMEKNNAAPRTINLRINSLLKFSEFCKKPIVLKRIKFQRTLHTENVPTMAEYERLLDYLKGYNMGYYFDVKLMATTGARVSEFLQITWEDIAAGEVMLKGKGGKYRHFFFSKDLIKEAIPYMKSHNLSGIVCKNRYGEPMATRGIAQSLKDWGSRVGIDRSKMHPHAFRHFFAKMYLKKNKDVVQLAELLGHSSIDTTKIYLQKSHDEQKRDFNRNVTW